MPGATQQDLGREREHGLDILPLLGSRGGVPRALWVHYLLVDLKHEGGN